MYIAQLEGYNTLQQIHNIKKFPGQDKKFLYLCITTMLYHIHTVCYNESQLILG